jgi:hypothetical protein
MARRAPQPLSPRPESPSRARGLGRNGGTAADNSLRYRRVSSPIARRRGDRRWNVDAFPILGLPAACLLLCAMPIDRR